MDRPQQREVHLVGLHSRCRRSALVLPFDLGLGDADQHALFNQLSLELGDSAEHVEHEPAGRGRGASAFDGESSASSDCAVIHLAEVPITLIK
jgi:hypothetical protein